MIDFFAKITFILKRHSLTILVFYLSNSWSLHSTHTSYISGS